MSCQFLQMMRSHFTVLGMKTWLYKRYRGQLFFKTKQYVQANHGLEVCGSRAINGHKVQRPKFSTVLPHQQTFISSLRAELVSKQFR